MHAQDFQEPKGDTIWIKHKEEQASTQNYEATKKVVQIISKNQINTRLTPKFTK
jgi:hypothetical protein